MSGDTWHCKQLPSGDNPIVVCERETLLAEIERLRKALGDAGGAIDRMLAKVKQLCDAGDALYAVLNENVMWSGLDEVNAAWQEARRER